MIITQNGKARMFVMDIAEHERQQETPALLKLLGDVRQYAKKGFGNPRRTP
jgi:hypothetical protein